jgi:hypothetical protein
VGFCETAHSIQIEGWVGPRVGLKSVEKRKFCLCWEINPSSPIVKPVEWLPYYLSYFVSVSPLYILRKELLGDILSNMQD